MLFIFILFSYFLNRPIISNLHSMDSKCRKLTYIKNIVSAKCLIVSCILFWVFWCSVFIESYVKHDNENKYFILLSYRQKHIGNLFRMTNKTTMMLIWFYIKWRNHLPKYLIHPCKLLWIKKINKILWYDVKITKYEK